MIIIWKAIHPLHTAVAGAGEDKTKKEDYLNCGLSLSWLAFLCVVFYYTKK
jgi:hypothetical protein